MTTDIIVPLQQLPQGNEITRILQSKGPIVNGVILRAGSDDDSTGVVVETISIDTTPKKQMTKEILGGPFTFLGQYEDEGIVLMMRRQDDNDTQALPKNTHKLQPPFDQVNIRGDVLIMKVAPEEQVDNSNNEEEFFLNYTKEDYLKFAARTDVVPPTPPAEEDEEEEMEEENDAEEDDDDEEEEKMEGEDDDDEEDDDDGNAMIALLLGQVIKRFQEENGRMPNEEELKNIQLALAQKMGMEFTNDDDDDEDNEDEDDKEKDDTTTTKEEETKDEQKD